MNGWSGDRDIEVKSSTTKFFTVSYLTNHTILKKLTVVWNTNDLRQIRKNVFKLIVSILPSE